MSLPLQSHPDDFIMAFLFVLILIAMSKYKTPFPMDVETSKALEVRTSKYRLPFRKDEPIEDLHVSLNNLSQQNITLHSEIRLPKLAVSSELEKHIPPRKHRSNLGTHEEVNSSVRSEKQSFRDSYLEVVPQQRSLKTEPNEPKITQRERADTERLKEDPQTKAKLSASIKKKRRFLSSASKYADDEGPNVDAIEESDEEPVSKKKQQKNIDNQLPVIGENRGRGERQDSDEDLKIWEDLSKDIEKYQQKKEKQELLKKKIKLRHHKNRKSHKKQQQSELPFSPLHKELRNSSSNVKHKKRSQSTASNDAFYSLMRLNNNEALPNKNKLKSLEQMEVKESGNLMDQLKEIIAMRNEKPSKKRSRLPIEFYIHSYEQIKSINPFFRKLSQMEGCILLNIGRLVMFDPNKYICNEGDQSKEVFIIVYGKALLSNKFRTLKKFALTGETLGEEELFQNEKSYMERLKEPGRVSYFKYDAKALSKSCLLKIQMRRYYKMSCELNRMGYKQQFNLIDNLFRINYLNKQTNLHYNERDRVQTEASSSSKGPPKHGLSFF